MNFLSHSKRLKSFFHENIPGDIFYRNISNSSYDMTYAILHEKKEKYALKIMPMWNSNAYDFYVNMESNYTPRVVCYDTLDIGHVIITEWINGKYPNMDGGSLKQWKNIGIAYARFQKVIGTISYGHKLDRTNLRDQCYVVSNYIGKLKYGDCVSNLDLSLIEHIDHGDLNVHNILIDTNNDIFFLDFSSIINRSSLCGLCVLKNSIFVNSKNINEAKSIWIEFLKSYLSKFNFKYIHYFDEIIDASTISVAYMYILAEIKYSLSQGFFLNEITYWCDHYQKTVEQNKSNNKLQRTDNPLVLY